MMSSNNGAVIQVHGLNVSFGRVQAVNEATFEVAKGSVYALIGRNGSGKSTTIRCLLGQLKPNGGSTTVLGLDSWRHRRRIMERVGVAPEVPDIPPSMTSAQVSRFVEPLYFNWDNEEFLKRIDRFQISPDARFSTLSKGQRKSVSLALALSSAPEVVFLDDPTLGLDAVARKGLYDELIGELAERGTTILITTHDLAGIEGVADHVGVMHKGRIVLDDGIEAIKSRYLRMKYPKTGESSLDQPVRGDGVLMSRVTGGVVEVLVSDPDAPGVRGIAESVGDRLRTEGLSLEEVFIALCGAGQGESS